MACLLMTCDVAFGELAVVQRCICPQAHRMLCTTLVGRRVRRVYACLAGAPLSRHRCDHALETVLKHNAQGWGNHSCGPLSRAGIAKRCVMTQLNKARLTTVMRSIGEAKAAINNTSDTATPGSINHTLTETLGLLEQFASAGSVWLAEKAGALESRQKDGGSDRDAQEIASVLQRYPPRYAQHLHLDQTLFDLRVMWHVYLQRTHQPELLPAIHRLESVARHALNTAVNAKLLDQMPRVVVYLQKVPSIRILPYARVVFIGLPYWMTDINRDSANNVLLDDLLAIPHEIGHYVYFRGMTASHGGAKRAKLLRASIANSVKRYVQAEFANPEYPNVKRQLRDVSSSGAIDSVLSDHWRDTSAIRVQDTMKRWSEEAFADAYALASSGIVSVASLMDIALDRAWHGSIANLDDPHPAAFIRPMALLAQLGARSTKAVSGECAELFKYWRGRSGADRFEQSPKLDDLFTAPPYSVDSVYTGLTKLFAFCGSLLASGTVGKGTKAPQTSRSRAVMLDEWRASILGVIKAPRREVLDADTPISDYTWKSWIARLSDEYTKLELTAIKDRDLVEWVCALSAGGWTEGPANGGNRPT
jgi:hypothetical protein